MPSVSEIHRKRAAVEKLLRGKLMTFRPRPDRPEMFDQQTGYVESLAKIAFCVGGNGCLGGEQEIYDPVAGVSRRVDSIDGEFHVWSRNEATGAVEVAMASRPWVKGTADLYRVTLSGGQHFICTLEHRVLCADGKTWRPVQELHVGDVLFAASTAPNWTYGVMGIEFLRRDVFYDLEVEENHNYLAEGVFHHNSGKTLSSAIRCARFVLHRAAPRHDTPFMVVSDTYRQVGNICWKEKLSTLIPPEYVDWDRATWYSTREGLPFTIPLKPYPEGTDRNWCLEFRSLDQGREHFQGRSFGGFWFSEQFSWPIFEEVLRGCRDTWYDGAHFAEFTPVDPDLSMAVEEQMDKSPAGWEFFRLNTSLNMAVSENWKETFFSAVSPELLETRRTGAMPTFLGSIYTNFNPAIHVLDDDQWAARFGKPLPGRYCDYREFKDAMPIGMWYRRALDWGESIEHPFVVLWAFKDGAGNWAIFDEYVEDTGTVLYDSRREEIKNRWPWLNQNPYFGNTYADPSRPLLIQEFTCDGINTVAGQNSVDSGIEYVRNLLKPNKITKRPALVIHKRNCPRLIKGMRKYRWVKGVTEGKNPHVARAVPLKWQDDEVDTLRYLCFSDRVDVAAPPSAVFAAGDHDRHGVLGARRR